MARTQTVLLVLLATMALAQAKMCNKRWGWESFKVEEGKVLDKMGNEILEKTAGQIIADLTAQKKITGCVYGAKDVQHSCMRPVISKNVVKYGEYDSRFKMSFQCPTGMKWFTIRSLTKVARKGQILDVDYEVKP